MNQDGAKYDVSVVIAAKDEQIYAAEAVRSILGQQGVLFELVFVDDGSTDRTGVIVAEIAARHPNLRLVRNPGKGKVSAFNYGVSLAQGAWVCIFAGDDVMPAGSLAARWQAVKDVVSDKPVVGLCRLVIMSEIKSHDGVVVPRDPNRGGLTGVSYLMDRRALEMLFPVPESLLNEDTWLETGVLHFDLTLVHSGVIGCKVASSLGELDQHAGALCRVQQADHAAHAGLSVVSRGAWRRIERGKPPASPGQGRVRGRPQIWKPSPYPS